jgi:hypothetical protein
MVTCEERKGGEGGGGNGGGPDAGKGTCATEAVFGR